MAGGVAHVNLVLAIRLILGIGTGAGALHNLARPEVEAAVAVGVGHGQARNGGVPVDAAPAEIDVLGVVAKDKGRRIGGVVLRGQRFLRTQSGNVARLQRHAVPNFWLVGVPGIENHDALVGQHQKRRVVMVVGLKAGAHQHVGLPPARPVVLRGLDVAVHVNIAYVRGVDGAGAVLVVQRPRVGKPAPGALIGHYARSGGTVVTNNAEKSAQEQLLPQPSGR